MVKKYRVCLMVLWVLLVSATTQAQEKKSGKTFRDCPDCPEMVVIPAGSFDMGSNDEQNETPARRITISRAFAMGKYEVTQAEWRAIMGANPPELKFTSCGNTCPVDRVSWNDAQEFIQRLNAKTGKQYRLPTEAEWEYACYAGSRTEYCGGNDPNAVAWFDGNSNDQTHPAGQKQANGYGLYDMSGNVWEWVEDCAAEYCEQRVLRGGSWFNFAGILRSTIRVISDPGIRSYNDGFRVVRTLP